MGQKVFRPRRPISSRRCYSPHRCVPHQHATTTVQNASPYRPPEWYFPFEEFRRLALSTL